MIYTYTPIQFEQLHLGFASVVLSTLFFLRFPESMVFLIGWWNSCQPTEQSLEWVSMVYTEILPGLEFTAQQHSGIEAKIENLTIVTRRHVLLLHTGRPGANILFRCLYLLWCLKTNDWQNRSFFPWRTWSERKALLSEIEDEVSKVRDAVSVSMNAPNNRMEESNELQVCEIAVRMLFHEPNPETMVGDWKLIQ